MQACAQCCACAPTAESFLWIVQVTKTKQNMNSRDRQFWTEFLLLYRSLPAVWKVKSPEYSSRALKSAGYEQLVQKLHEVEPHADRALVVKKINSFRTNFRRDLRKRVEGERLGEAPFESTLWYFELLGFLEDQESSLGSSQSLHKANSPEQQTHSEAFHSKKRRSSIKYELTAAPATALAATPRSSRPPLDESEALAHIWRNQYDELAPRQKLLARKLISDVLYYGCLDQLAPHHVTQLQQLMLPHTRISSPQIEDVSSSPQRRLENCDDDNDASDTLDENG
ncbi:uncharacterized protein LOC132790138 [Drosophila nasuta]|uniref:uncharacterized protein LOC132790138 n=1 Tax=Drosophila nasuta TaxID=42062 RepID=UPI00295E5C1D|nr:uncharacterized protein LOC132790138 [Drosophila nasuta]